MRFSGKTMKEHIQLLTPLFGIIAAVWALRFFLGQVGAPGWLIQPFSVTLIVPVSIILMTLLIRVKRFGGYPSVIVGAFFLVVWSQLLIVAAILLSVFGGVDNIFTAPQFSPENDPNHMNHIIGHLTSGVASLTILSSLMGCVLFYMLRRTHP
ncbi:MAG TPA: hypothetical protein VMY18_11725, partial [Acidobacteriota bacterium]|nr:hypothetical protein [Acidobacteriota bacterium]